MRPPACCDGLARAAAHFMRCVLSLLLLIDVVWLCVRVDICQQQLRSYDALMSNRLGCTIQSEALCACRIKALVPFLVYRPHSMPPPCPGSSRRHDCWRNFMRQDQTPDRGHFFTESCSDDHLNVCPCRTGGMTASAAASETVAKRSVLVLTLYFPHSGYCSSLYCTSCGCCSGTLCCRFCCG